MAWRIICLFARQRFSQWIARPISQWMAAACLFFHSSTVFMMDCLFFHLSMDFTVCGPYCSANGSGLLILPLVNGFPDGLHADFLSGWQCIARSSTRQRLLQFAHPIAPRMGADCQYLRSSISFMTVRAPYWSADGSGLLILTLVNA